MPSKKAVTKVLHVITRMDMGGSAQNTLLTCIGLADKYELILVFGLSHESKMTAAERQAAESKLTLARNKGVKCIRLQSLVRKINPLQDFCTFVVLCRLMRKERPDIIHTHTSKAGLLGRWAAWITGMPCIVHTPHGHIFWGHFNALISKLFFIIEKITSLVTDRTIALTEGERQDYVDYLGTHPDKTCIVHSGVDIDRYMNMPADIKDKKNDLDLDSGSFVVGTVGWLLPIKGPMHLFDAMLRIWRQKLNAQLVYVGKGDLEKDLKQRAAEMGVSEKIKFLGWRDDVHEIIHVFDVFVLPSLNEGMGRVLVEAMAAGKPVVASNVGGIPDLIKNGRNGFLVEPGDSKGLAAAIESLMRDKNMRQAMGQKGRIMAHNFSREKMISKIERLYQDLAGCSC